MNTEKTRIREHIEWTNMRWNNAPDDCKSRILLIGDSIVAGHGEFVHDVLKNEYCVDSFATAKCVSDIDYMRELNYMLSTNDYSLVIFNNGLHGFEIDDKDYEENLEEVMTDLKKRMPKLAWRSSTPMREESNLELFSARHTPVIQKRNAFAMKVAEKLDIPTLDLYTPMSEHVEYFLDDAVHYNDEGKTAQAEIIADFIRKII